MLHHQIKLLFKMFTFFGFLAITPSIGLAQASTTEETKNMAAELEKVKAELEQLKKALPFRNEQLPPLEQSQTMEDSLPSFILIPFAAGILRSYMQIFTLSERSLESGFNDIPFLVTFYYMGHALVEKSPNSQEMSALLSACFITAKEKDSQNRHMPNLEFYTSMNALIIALGFAWYDFHPLSFFLVPLATFYWIIKTPPPYR